MNEQINLETILTPLGKEYIFDHYCRIILDFKNYERITKKKMIEAIQQEYQNPQNIVEICTTKELKFLEKQLYSKSPLNSNDYQWEIKNLKAKFLLNPLRDEPIIMPEFQSSIKNALKIVNWDNAQGKDRVNEFMIGLIKVLGSINANVIIDLTKSIFKCEEEIINYHVRTNKVFNYFVYTTDEYLESLDDYQEIFIYHEIYKYKNLLDTVRKEKGRAAAQQINFQDYVSIFYHDFNLNNKTVKQFYDELQKVEYNSALKNAILKNILLDGNRQDIYILINQIYQNKIPNQKEFTKLMNQALDESPSAALNGLTPNQAKKDIEEERQYQEKKVKNYHPQQNAHLSPKEVDQFYRLYFDLLDFVNTKYHLFPNLKKLAKKKSVDPSNIADLRDKLLENIDELIKEFISQNPFKLKKQELDIVSHFQYGKKGVAIIAKYDEDYTQVIFDSKIYMLKGLTSNIDTIIPNKELPVLVEIFILPFKKYLIYDSILKQGQISMGTQLYQIVENDLNRLMKYYHL